MSRWHGRFSGVMYGFVSYSRFSLFPSPFFSPLFIMHEMSIEEGIGSLTQGWNGMGRRVIYG